MQSISTSNAFETWTRRLRLVATGLSIMGVIGSVVMAIIPAACYSGALHRIDCQNNLRRIGEALQRYHEVHDHFPPGAYSETSYGWAAHLLPFLDRDDLAERIDLAAQPMARRERMEGEPIYELLCPASVSPLTSPEAGFGPFAHTSYRGFAGSSLTARDGMLFQVDDEHLAVRRDDVTDGTAHTILVAETDPTDSDLATRSSPPPFAIWAGTNGQLAHTLVSVQTHANSEVPKRRNSSHHSDFHVLMTDGSTRTLSTEIDPDVYHALGTRAGGQGTYDW